MDVIFGFLGTVAAVTAAGFGYLQSRGFVARRLRYVDQAQTPAAPVIAGVAATALAAPVVFLLPVVGAGTAVLFGLSVAFGTRSGIKQIKRGALLP